MARFYKSNVHIFLDDVNRQFEAQNQTLEQYVEARSKTVCDHVQSLEAQYNPPATEEQIAVAKAQCATARLTAQADYASFNNDFHSRGLLEDALYRLLRVNNGYQAYKIQEWNDYESNANRDNEIIAPFSCFDFTVDNNFLYLPTWRNSVGRALFCHAFNTSKKDPSSNVTTGDFNTDYSLNYPWRIIRLSYWRRGIVDFDYTATSNNATNINKKDIKGVAVYTDTTNFHYVFLAKQPFYNTTLLIRMSRDKNSLIKLPANPDTPDPLTSDGWKVYVSDLSNEFDDVYGCAIDISSLYILGLKNSTGKLGKMPLPLLTIPNFSNEITNVGYISSNPPMLNMSLTTNPSNVTSQSSGVTVFNDKLLILTGNSVHSFGASDLLSSSDAPSFSIADVGGGLYSHYRGLAYANNTLYVGCVTDPNDPVPRIYSMGLEFKTVDMQCIKSSTFQNDNPELIEGKSSNTIADTETDFEFQDMAIRNTTLQLLPENEDGTVRKTTAYDVLNQPNSRDESQDVEFPDDVSEVGGIDYYKKDGVERFGYIGKREYEKVTEESTQEQNPYIAPTDNYRKVNSSESNYVQLPNTIDENTSITGFTNIRVSTYTQILGQPENYAKNSDITVTNANANSVAAYHLLYRISSNFERYALIKTEAGDSNIGVPSETTHENVSGSAALVASTKRIVEIIFYNNNTNSTEHWKYDDSVVQGSQLNWLKDITTTVISEGNIPDNCYITDINSYRRVHNGDVEYTDLSVFGYATNTPNYRKVIASDNPPDISGIEEIYSSTTLSGYTNVKMLTTGLITGKPEKCTTASTNAYLAYWLYARLYDTCDLPLDERALIQTTSLGPQTGYVSETVCGETSTANSGQVNGKRVTDLIVKNPENGLIDHWIFDNTVTPGQSFGNPTYTPPGFTRQNYTPLGPDASLSDVIGDPYAFSDASPNDIGKIGALMSKLLYGCSYDTQLGYFFYKTHVLPSSTTINSSTICGYTTTSDASITNKNPKRINEFINFVEGEPEHWIYDPEVDANNKVCVNPITLTEAICGFTKDMAEEIDMSGYTSSPNLSPGSEIYGLVNMTFDKSNNDLYILVRQPTSLVDTIIKYNLNTNVFTEVSTSFISNIAGVNADDIAYHNGYLYVTSQTITDGTTDIVVLDTSGAVQQTLKVADNSTPDAYIFIHSNILYIYREEANQFSAISYNINSSNGQLTRTASSGNEGYRSVTSEDDEYVDLNNKNIGEVQTTAEGNWRYLVANTSNQTTVGGYISDFTQVYSIIGTDTALASVNGTPEKHQDGQSGIPPRYMAVGKIKGCGKSYLVKALSVNNIGTSALDSETVCGYTSGANTTAVSYNRITELFIQEYSQGGPVGSVEHYKYESSSNTTDINISSLGQDVPATDNYREVNSDDTEYLSSLPSSIDSSTTVTGFINAAINLSSGDVWGKPEAFTSGGNNATLASMLYGRLFGCNSLSGNILYKITAIGNLDSFESQSVCSYTSTSYGPWTDNYRLVELIATDNSGNVKHYKYDNSVSENEGAIKHINNVTYDNVLYLNLEDTKQFIAIDLASKARDMTKDFALELSEPSNEHVFAISDNFIYAHRYITDIGIAVEAFKNCKNSNLLGLVEMHTIEKPIAGTLTNHYRRVKFDDPSYKADLPSDITSSTTLDGYTNSSVYVASQQTFGVSESYRSSTPPPLAWLYNRLYNVCPLSGVYGLYRSASAGTGYNIPTNIDEDICNIFQGGLSSLDSARRVTEFIVKNPENSNIEHWIYDNAVEVGDGSQPLYCGFELIESGCVSTNNYRPVTPEDSDYIEDLPEEITASSSQPATGYSSIILSTSTLTGLKGKPEKYQLTGFIAHQLAARQLLGRIMGCGFNPNVYVWLKFSTASFVSGQSLPGETICDIIAPASTTVTGVVLGIDNIIFYNENTSQIEHWKYDDTVEKNIGGLYNMTEAEVRIDTTDTEEEKTVDISVNPDYYDIQLYARTTAIGAQTQIQILRNLVNNNATETMGTISEETPSSDVIYPFYFNKSDQQLVIGRPNTTSNAAVSFKGWRGIKFRSKGELLYKSTGDALTSFNLSASVYNSSNNFRFDALFFSKRKNLIFFDYGKAVSQNVSGEYALLLNNWLTDNGNVFNITTGEDVGDIYGMRFEDIGIYNWTQLWSGSQLLDSTSGPRGNFTLSQPALNFDYLVCVTGNANHPTDSLNSPTPVSANLGNTSVAFPMVGQGVTTLRFGFFDQVSGGIDSNTVTFPFISGNLLAGEFASRVFGFNLEELSDNQDCVLEQGNPVPCSGGATETIHVTENYNAPTDNYRRVNYDEEEFVAGLPSSLNNSTSLTGYTNVPAYGKIGLYGKPEQYARNAFTAEQNSIYFHLFVRLFESLTQTCNVIRNNSNIRMLIKNTTVSSPEAYEREIICNDATNDVFESDGSDITGITARRVSEVIVQDPNTALTEHWEYDSSILEGANLTHTVGEDITVVLPVAEWVFGSRPVSSLSDKTSDEYIAISGDFSTLYIQNMTYNNGSLIITSEDRDIPPPPPPPLPDFRSTYIQKSTVNVSLETLGAFNYEWAYVGAYNEDLIDNKIQYIINAYPKDSRSSVSFSQVFDLNDTQTKKAIEEIASRYAGLNYSISSQVFSFLPELTELATSGSVDQIEEKVDYITVSIRAGVYFKDDASQITKWSDYSDEIILWQASERPPMPPPVQRIDGQCGETAFTCEAGNLVVPDQTDECVWHWMCTGENGGRTDTCTVQLEPVNGIISPVAGRSAAVRNPDAVDGLFDSQENALAAVKARVESLSEFCSQGVYQPGSYTHNSDNNFWAYDFSCVGSCGGTEGNSSLIARYKVSEGPPPQPPPPPPPEKTSPGQCTLTTGYTLGSQNLPSWLDIPIDNFRGTQNNNIYFKEKDNTGDFIRYTPDKYP